MTIFADGEMDYRINRAATIAGIKARLSVHFDNEMRLAEDMRAADLTPEESRDLIKFMKSLPHYKKNIADHEIDLASGLLEASKRR